jgi:predicted DNA-binding protein
MKVDLDELKKDIEAELKGLETRRHVLTKRMELIKGVKEIVEEALSDSEDFRIQKALERMSTDSTEESDEKDKEGENLDEDPPLRIAFGK